MKPNYIIQETLNKVSLIGSIKEVPECIKELEEAKKVIEQKIQELKIILEGK